MAAGENKGKKRGMWIIMKKKDSAFQLLRGHYQELGLQNQIIRSCLFFCFYIKTIIEIISFNIMTIYLMEVSSSCRNVATTIMTILLQRRMISNCSYMTYLDRLPMPDPSASRVCSCICRQYKGTNMVSMYPLFLRVIFVIHYTPSCPIQSAHFYKFYYEDWTQNMLMVVVIEIKRKKSFILKTIKYFNSQTYINVETLFSNQNPSQYLLYRSRLC